VSKFESDELTKSFEEDLLQEATLVFYNAIMAYDEKQSEVEFGLYARICISNALVSQMRIINRRRLEQITDPENNAFHTDEVTFSPMDDILRQEKLRAMYAIIKDSLSDFEYLIWQKYMMGMTANEISKELRKSSKSINNAIYRIRKKLRELLK
jgi:RNA polymerase sporulation-specific sigma factor